MSLTRRLLVAALATVIWLIAPSAHAAAPRCDVRAATTFGPTPTLETQNASVDVGNSSCAPSSPLDMLNQGRTQTEIVFSNAPDLSLSPTLTIFPSPEVGELPRSFDVETPPSGELSSVDRPPRS
ncbi:MAG: hypothetical protein ABI461_01340 [Polyangiaceae bacterium]